MTLLGSGSHNTFCSLSVLQEKVAVGKIDGTLQDLANELSTYTNSNPSSLSNQDVADTTSVVDYLTNSITSSNSSLQDDVVDTVMRLE